MLADTLYLTFHGIGVPIVPQAHGEERYFVSEDTYRQTIAQLDALEAATGIFAEITFDDGNLSDYTVGLPALVENGRTGTFFVLAGRIDQKGYLSASQIRDLAAAGMTVGTHGYDHLDWRKLDAAGRERELVDSRKIIEDTLGQAVSYASIPFGGFDKAVLEDLRIQNYERVFSSSAGMTYRSGWFCPRRSLTTQFDPNSGLLPLASTKERLASTAKGVARRLRYRL